MSRCTAWSATCRSSSRMIFVANHIPGGVAAGQQPPRTPLSLNGKQIEDGKWLGAVSDFRSLRDFGKVLAFISACFFFSAKGTNARATSTGV